MKHELTVTLRPMMYTKSAQEQYDITKPFMVQILRGYKHTTIAELTGEHNVHYHSVVDIEGIKDKDKLLNRFRGYNKYLGRKTCSAVQYELSYDQYIIKSLKDTMKIIHDPVVNDDYNLLDNKVQLKRIFVHGNLDEENRDIFLTLLREQLH